MYEEPYRWIEAVGNRRQYLDDQFKQGSPIIGLSYADGILLVTVSRGTPKIYEVYDRIALGGIGHPADLEKLRFNILDMAHLEGFNRSPSDVTGARLLKYGLAPTIKQAFEEIFKAPFITKILLAELGRAANQDQFLSIDYDGSFEEIDRCAIIAATPSIQSTVRSDLLKNSTSDSLSLAEALESAVKAWAMGSLLQQSLSYNANSESQPSSGSGESSSSEKPSDEEMFKHIRSVLGERSLECTVLDRSLSGSSKYRTLSRDEVTSLLPSAVNAA